jgi:hypothetical protein
VSEVDEIAKPCETSPFTLKIVKRQFWPINVAILRETIPFLEHIFFDLPVSVIVHDENLHEKIWHFASVRLCQSVPVWPMVSSVRLRGKCIPRVKGDSARHDTIDQTKWAAVFT